MSSVLEESKKKTETQTRQQQAQEKFYTDFYKEHKEFRRDEDHFLVRSMLTEKAVEYGSLPDTKAVRKKLAEDAGKYLKARTVTKPPMVEGVENALPKPDEEEGEKTKVTSLSDILKAKQAKHRPEPLAPTGSEAQ